MPQGPIPIASTKTPTGSLASLTSDAQNAQYIAPRHGKYYSSAYAKAMFGCASQVGVAFTVALAAVYTGLCLSNPAASGVNLAVKRIRGVMTVAPAAEDALGLITGFAAGGITVHTTALDANIQNQFLGSAVASKAHVDAACTLVGTPLWERWLASMPTAATFPSFSEDLDDAIIVPPGGYVAIGSVLAGGAAGFFGSFEWEEVIP